MDKIYTTINQLDHGLDLDEISIKKAMKQPGIIQEDDKKGVKKNKTLEYSYNPCEFK